MTAAATSTDVAHWVGDFGKTLFAELDELGDLVRGQLRGDAPRRGDLDIERYCHAMLEDTETPLAGAGVVMAPGRLADAAYWLEWWTADSRSGALTIAKLAAETDPRAVGFRDYTQLPWYARPFETGGRHVTGPYVDYLCTDQYTLTFTQPLLLGGVFGGVVGADVLVAWFEEQVLDLMDGIGRTCVLVNAAGRVVTSSDPTWVTGDLIRDLPLGAWASGADAPASEWLATRCEGLPFFVITRR